MNNNYHLIETDEVLNLLETNKNGLTEKEAKVRLLKFGPNELKEEAKEPWWKLLLAQFNNLLIYILVLSAVVSIFLGKTVEPVAIMVIVVLAGITGFIQEFQAGKAIESLKKMASPSARALRDGVEREVSTSDLVPGDVVVINSGDKVPADSRLLSASQLRIDEAALTGESLAVHKHIDAINGENIPLGDRKNMIFMGTSVVLGRAYAVVTATGMQTEFGKIADLLNKTESRKTPLQMSLDKLGKQLGIFSIVLATIVSLFDFFKGSPLADVFIWGVALAVAIIPEALPAVVTITLALGVKRMVTRRALIRKLPAVETLGATNIICSDKTGTLTQDEMTIRKIYTQGKLFDVGGVGYKPEGKIYFDGNEINHDDRIQLSDLLTKGVLCNDTLLVHKDGEWNVLGDPTEGSIVVAAGKLGITFEDTRNKHQRVHEIPFSSETKRMTTVSLFDTDKVAVSKGAPEVIIDSCRYIRKDGKIIEMTSQEKEEVLRVARSLGEDALRVLGIAEKVVTEDSNFEHIEKDMVLVGLVGMIDPPREEVRAAIQTCETAGIKPIMITGDHKITAVAVARELGIMKDGIAISGPELEVMSDEEFEKVVDRAEVYARISPAHKMKIVEALIKKGNVVAMTGDGVNDAPSLKRADIGVAMGITGTDVSKEAADMILTDDNFASIVAAVEEGRSIFENIRKYLVYLLSGNMGTVIGLVAALLLAYPVPLLAVHILFINFVMDGILAITLGVEPPEKGIMQRRPRSIEEGILNKPSISYIASVGIWIGLLCLYVFTQIGGAVPDFAATKASEYPMTLFFATLIVARIFNAFASRSISESIFSFGFLGNKAMLLGIGATILLSVATIHIGFFNKVFHTVALSFNDWMIVIAAGSTVLVYSEIHKLVMKAFEKK